MALPRLIECFQELDVIQEQIGILKIICHSFLPCVQVTDAEEKVFSRLMDQVCGLFDLALEDIQLYTQKGDRKSSLPLITDRLQSLVDLSEFLETCVCHMQTGNMPLEWSCLHSLPRGTIHFLRGAYGHCKVSGELYQELLSCLSVPLSNLFKKTHSLQVAFLRLLDNLRVSDPVTEQEVQEITQVCRGLFDVCQIVTSLDMKLMVTLWKAISKHAVGNKAHISQHLEVGDMVNHLCGEIQTGFVYLLQLLPRLDLEGRVLSQEDEKGFQKSLKILGFQMKILVMLVREFSDLLDRCEQQVYNLLLTLHRLLPPSLSAQQIDQKNLSEIQQHLTNATDVLIKAFLPNKVFIETLTGIEKVGALRDEDSFPDLQILLRVLDNLPQMEDRIQQLWVDHCLYPEDLERLSVIEVVFRTTARCSVEMGLPLYITDPSLTGKHEKSMTLYENCCTRVCGFLGSLTTKLFHKAEEVLLENILSHDLWCRLLAEDVWCFLVRYGSADLCRDQVNFLVELMKQSPPAFQPPSPLLSLTVRLIKCLAPEHQAELTQSLGASDDPVSLRVLASCVQGFSDPGLCQGVIHSVSEICSWLLREITTTEEYTQEDLHRLVLCLSCLCELLGQNDTIPLAVQPHVTSSITDTIGRLWKGIVASDWLNTSLSLQCLGKLILLSSYLLLSLDNDVLDKILTGMSSCVQQESSVHLHLTLVYFLRSFGKVRLPASPEQPQMLKRLSDLFVATLTSSDLFIYHHGLSAFTKFAEETLHEAVVPSCIEDQPGLQDCVVQFINKSPYTCSGELSRLDFLRIVPPCRIGVDMDSDSGVSDHQSGPSSKRPRLMENVNHRQVSQQLKTSVEELVGVLRETLSDLEAFTKSEDTDMTPQTWNNLEHIQTKIMDIMKEKG